MLAAACERMPTRKLGAIITQRPWQRQRGQLASAAAGATALPGHPESPQVPAAVAAAAAMITPLLPTSRPTAGRPATPQEIKPVPRNSRPSAFGALAPRGEPVVTTRLDPVITAADLDAAQEARRDAALDAALDADLKAMSGKSRYGSLDNNSLFGGLGNLDQSHFGAFDDQPSPARSGPPSQRKR
jgi:hypothetical protein